MVPEIALAKVRSNAAFDKVCTIGLNVIHGAKMVGADKIIGVDLNPAREAMARGESIRNVWRRNSA